MAPQVSQLQVAVVRGRRSRERRGRRWGRGQPISRLPQVVCGVGRLGVGLYERLVGCVGAVGTGWGWGGAYVEDPTRCGAGRPPGMGGRST